MSLTANLTQRPDFSLGKGILEAVVAELATIEYLQSPMVKFPGICEIRWGFRNVTSQEKVQLIHGMLSPLKALRYPDSVTVIAGAARP